MPARFRACAILLTIALLGAVAPAAPLEQHTLEQMLVDFDRVRIDPVEAAAKVRSTGRLTIAARRATFDIDLVPHDIRAPHYRAQVTREGGVVESLERVNLQPRHFLHRYPHELSGGQRQRAAIARTLVLEPEFVVADEPISMLDVSIRAGILDLLETLSKDLGLGVLYVSHDISTVRYICDRVAIMYLGAIVEEGPTEEVFVRPRHPYTAALLSAHPTLVRRARRAPALRGELPSPYQMPAGCRFNTRCAFAEERCFIDEPRLAEASPGHRVACHVLPELNVT